MHSARWNEKWGQARVLSHDSSDLPASSFTSHPHPPTPPPPEFEVDSRFTNLKYLGGGAYGTVVSALDTTKNVKVCFF